MDQDSEAVTPRYVIASERHGAADLEEHLEGGAPLVEVASVDELLAGGEGAREPGWVFLPPDTAPGVVVELVVGVASRSGAWSPLLMVEGDEGLDLVPVGPGYREGIREALARVNGEGSAPGLASFRLCLKALARTRHDMNNPLTAALAEVQLVLMDVEPGSEMGRALETIENQLRRIRDMIAELTVLRPPEG